MARRRLDLLLRRGSVMDADLSARIDRLARAFRNYADCYPLPLWAPGLAIDHEMRGSTEALFPLSRVSRCFDLLLRRGCRFEPMLAATYLHSCATWLDLLHKMDLQLPQADPTATLRRLALDGSCREAFLFALLLPQHYGGGFDRYPLQSLWISEWLADNFRRLQGKVRVLDSACGSGEGTYGLIELLHASGLGGSGCLVHGSTLEPIELFAAAHAYFPHDRDRERDYRARVAPLFGEETGLRVEFHLEDVACATGRDAYQLILCNGLLGGPLMHEPEELSGAIGTLAARLAPGGVLLAADRFHAGWRLRVPKDALATMLRRNGLTPLEIPEGVAGVKAVRNDVGDGERRDGDRKRGTKPVARGSNPIPPDKNPTDP